MNNFFFFLYSFQLTSDHTKCGPFLYLQIIYICINCSYHAYLLYLLYQKSHYHTHSGNYDQKHGPRSANTLNATLCYHDPHIGKKYILIINQAIQISVPENHLLPCSVISVMCIQAKYPRF